MGIIRILVVCQKPVQALHMVLVHMIHCTLRLCFILGSARYGTEGHRSKTRHYSKLHSLRSYLHTIRPRSTAIYIACLQVSSFGRNIGA